MRTPDFVIGSDDNPYLLRWWIIPRNGPRFREWGFACPKGWVHWREFTEPGSEGRVGRGCGEMS